MGEIIYDESGVVIDDPDMELGYICTAEMELDGQVRDVLRYKLFTEEQLAEHAESMRQARERAAEREAREAFLEDAPAVQGEMLDALAEVGSLAAESAASVEELMDAIVELAGIVAASAK